ncbi:MAG: ribbon-helix-helix protein, CopG family [Gemmatimonadales bacterium]
MSRTTLAIDDRLLKRLKCMAAERGKTLGEVVNDLLRQALAVAPNRSDFRLELRGWEARAQPGVDLCDRDKLFDLMDGR